MPALTVPVVERLDDDAKTLSVGDVAGYLQAQLGQRMAAHLCGLGDPKQVGRYARPGGPTPHPRTERRLREGYKVVRMIVEAFDDRTARAWLFGTNTRLDDRAPIDLLRVAEAPDEFTPVVRAARQLASFQA